MRWHLLLLLAVPGMVAGCGQGDRPALAAAAPKTVGVVSPTQADVNRTLTQPATIQGAEEAVLYARAAGYLKTISVDKGDRVHAGQVLAVIESPELLHQQDQAGSTYRQAEATTAGVEASRRKARADVDQGEAVVAGARASTHEAETRVGRARAELARVEAQIPRLQALIRESQAVVEQATEQQAQAQAEVTRAQQQVRGVQALLRAAQSGLDKAQADSRLQQLTYDRLKAIQQKDSGLVPAQDVDTAQARAESARGEVELTRSRVESVRQDVGAAEQQVEAARRGAAAAAKRVDAARGRAQATTEDLEVSRKEIESARQQVRVAEAEVSSSESRVAVAEAQRRTLTEQVTVSDAQVRAARQGAAGSRSAMSAARAMASYTQITAPYDGIITERLADPGAFIQNASANQAAARGIVKLVRDDSLRVMIPVPETDLPKIHNGQAALIRVDAFPNEEFSGQVGRFAAAVDPKSRTMLTEVAIPNPGARIRPGMYARVTLTLETHKNALSIPTEAVFGKEERFVYVVENGRARKTPVTVGVDDGKMAEITTGLKPGAQVVLTGRDALVDGAEVKAQPAKTEPPK